PEFAEKIFDGTKQFEFRRTIFKKNVKTVIVYASSPIKKVIGEFEIDTIIQENISCLWERTKRHAGIDKTYFLKYFNKKQTGYAIKIKAVRKYIKPKCLKQDFSVNPPQSFQYMHDQ
ncbi:MAG TPA: hypothetical protein VFR58_17970, partial [Flavisolibacter sp.]|nr:hypothetical protein [Flavisolibacter sp.]